MSSDTPGPNLRRRPSLSGALARARRRAVEPRRELTSAPPLESAPDLGGAGVGDLVAPCVLWSPAWDRAELEALRQRMEAAGGGRHLIFVEPVSALGWRRLAQRVLGRRWRRRLGHSFERDVPAELRAAGFVLTTIDRFALGPGSVRTYAYGEAVPDTVRWAPLFDRNR